MLAGEGRILGQHIQIPERHARRQTLSSTCADRRCQLQESEVGSCIRRLCPSADTHQFNFREDKAIAARVLAHKALQVGEPSQVEDFLLSNFVPHTGIPAMVGFDQANHAATAVAVKGLLDVALIVGDKVWAIGRVGLRAHGNAIAAVSGQRGYLQRCVDFGSVVVTAHLKKQGLIRRIKTLLGDMWLWKCRGWNRNIEQPWQKRNPVDGLDREVFPGTEIANIPPKVRLLSVAAVVLEFRTQVHGGIWLGKVVGHGHSRIVIVCVLQVGWKCWGSWLRNCDGRLDESRLSRYMGRGVASSPIGWVIAVSRITIAT